MAERDDKPKCRMCGETAYIVTGDELCSKCIAVADKREKLRDQFATAALGGSLSDPLILAAMRDTAQNVNSNLADVAAKTVYEYADAMLVEREIVRDKHGRTSADKQPRQERPEEICFDVSGGMRVRGRVVGEDGEDWILDCGEEMGLIRRKKKGD